MTALSSPSPAFDGELGFQWAAGTFGEPQIVAFHPELQVRETAG